MPFRGSATVEVISGQIDFAIDNVASYTPFLKSGQARALAVTASTRWPVFPDVPTMAEAGVPDFVMTSWGALAMPAATPPAVVEKLSLAVQEISREPGMKEKFLAAGALFTTRSPQESNALAAAERVKWKEVVRLSGAKVE